MLHRLHDFILHNFLFQEKLDKEIREPFFTFRIHDEIRMFLGIEPDSSFGIFAPSFTFWNHLLIILLIVTIYGIFTAWIVYKFILLPNRASKIKSIVSPHLLGYGFIIPITLVMPKIMLETLDIRNLLHRFIIIAIMPVLITFRTSEAVHGFTPPGTDSSFSHYAYYFASTLAPVYCHDSEKNITVEKPSKEKALKSVKYFLTYAVITGLYVSLFGPSFQPLNCDIDANKSWAIFTDSCRSNIMVNNIVGAGLFQLYLTTLIYGVGVITILAGIDVNIEETMKNPLLTATSPSDFWGRKWNLIVHGALKGGVFKPVYKYTSRSLALFACFFASGLLHEYILLYLFKTHYVSRCFVDNGANGQCNVTFSPTTGKQTAFFLWNGVLVGIEMLIVKKGIFKKSRSFFAKLPALIKSFFIIMTAIPVSHWFLHCYIQTNLFSDHGKLGFLIIQKL